MNSTKHSVVILENLIFLMEIFFCFACICFSSNLFFFLWWKFIFHSLSLERHQWKKTMNVFILLIITVLLSNLFFFVLLLDLLKRILLISMMIIRFHEKIRWLIWCEEVITTWLTFFFSLSQWHQGKKKSEKNTRRQTINIDEIYLNMKMFIKRKRDFLAIFA